MSPSVALCNQQHEVLSDHLSGYLVKRLTGEDGVDNWSDQRLWDAVLGNVRLVVGTPAVLYDALTHGFIHMSRLALLVFDEAHRCIKGSPMNVIMQNFYHPAKARREAVPSILGLSASPVTSAKSGTLEDIERNLDSAAVTPKHHRSELEAFVHPPQMISVIYTESGSDDMSRLPQICATLRQAVTEYDLSTDPYVVELKHRGDVRALRELEAIPEKKKTYCHKQLAALQQRSNTLHEQLGPTLAEWYVRTCIQQFNGGIAAQSLVLPDVTEREKQHLASIFNTMTDKAPEQSYVKANMPLTISDKARLLVDTLQQHWSSDVRCIVFVEQRVTVTALARLLRSKLDAAYSIGTFVGTSTFAGRKTAVADLADAKVQQQDLADFRTGSRNIMIATNVLEEGIDVTACNLVICFDPPKNLVSFVQRRGRARQANSKFILFLAAGDTTADPSRWQRLEAEMKEAYMDELRQLKPAGAEDEEALGSRVYRVATTGALLTLENAKAHLYHFCATSSQHTSRYVDLRPEFTTTNNGGEKAYTAHVALPSFVHPSVRQASSSQAWRSEEAAIKDAAFEAYLALHKAALVNDNLLPLIKDYGPDEGQLHVDQPSIVTVSKRISSWTGIFRHTGYENADWQAAKLTLILDCKAVLCLPIWLPTAVPSIATFPLYWNEEKTYFVNIKPLAEYSGVSEDSSTLSLIRIWTWNVLRSLHGSRMSDKLDDFPVLFSPEGRCEMTDTKDLLLDDDCMPAAKALNGYNRAEQYGLIRVKGQIGRAYFLSGITPQSNNVGEPEVIVTSFPKRRDFLHPVYAREDVNAAYTTRQAFPLADCTVDKLPAKYAILAAFVPSIMHRLDLNLLAQDLQDNVLRPVEIRNLSLTVEAITSPAAGEDTDYNRLEFLGDTVLKFCAVLQVMAQHLNWPEGYLSLEKYRMVSNNTLAKAALKAGLDRYVLNTPFTGAKWRPTYVSELFADEDGRTREMSSKVLADVVEALIGASMVDDGLPRAFTCMRTLLPNEDWLSHHDAVERLLGDSDQNTRAELSLLERLIGHNFDRKALLIEAITHVSFPNNNTGLSYERLEFLGDAVLDLLVVPKLFAHPRKLKHWELHRIREALVSGNFLGYCCMQYAIEEDTFDVVQAGRSVSGIKRSAWRVHLHDFVRAGGQLVQAKMQSLAAFEEFRNAVQHGLEHGSEYPWPDLIAMRPQKFLSDVIESVLGALYLDTHGDLSVCEGFVEKLGLFKHMRRILDKHVETAFPKERVGILAGTEGVEYRVSRREVEEGKKVFDCAVEVGGTEVASAKHCCSREAAEARAAMNTVRVLEVKIGADSSNRKRKLDIAMRDESMVNVGTFDAGNEDGDVKLPLP